MKMKFEYCKVIEKTISYLLIMVVTKSTAREPEKPWVGFEYIPRYQERNAFTGRDQHAIDLLKEYKDSIYVSRWYNASFVCQIPLFTLTLPQRGRTGEVRPSSIAYNLGLPMIQALFILAGIALFSPIIFPEERRRSMRQVTLNFRSVNDFLDSQMHFISESAIGRSMRTEEKRSMFYFMEKNLKVVFESVLNSIDQWLEYLPYFAKNKLKYCFQWSVCEMYNKPKKYGLIGLLFRALFPYDNDLNNKSSNVISNYRLAAVYGKNRSNDCKYRFKGCSITKLEVIRELIYFLLGRSEHKVSKGQKNVILFLMDNLFSYLES